MAIATGNPEACGFDDDGRDKDEFFFDFISNSIYPALAAMAISANLTAVKRNSSLVTAA
jgi:hypothetical protein